MEKGGLAKRSSHPLGRYRGMESFRRRKHVLQYGKTVSSKGSIKLQFPIHREKGDRLSFRPRLCHLRKQQCYLSSRRRQSGKYNRIVFSIYPDCDGARIVNMNLTFRNADTPAKKGYNQPSGFTPLTLLIRSGTNASSK